MTDAQAIPASTGAAPMSWRTWLAEGSNVLCASLVLLVLALGLAIQSLTFLNHDVAWVLYSSGTLLDGANFGHDIVAANPPLIWWISLIPNSLSRATGWPVIGVFRGFVFAASAMSVYCFRRQIFPNQLTARQIFFLVFLAWLLSFAVHRDYGQREHLALILTLPYMAAVCARLEGRQSIAWQGYLIGIAAGAGIALKPYFVTVPLLLEGLLLWRMRNAALVLRPEAVGAGAAVAAYAIALPLFAPTWLFDAAPDIHQVYWAFEQPIAWLSLIDVLLLPMILFGWTFFGNRSQTATVLALAGLGFLVAALIQGKLYSYHIYPAYALLVLAGMAGALCGPRKPSRLVIALATIVMLQSLFVAQANLANRMETGEVGSSIDAVSTFVAHTVPPGGSFISISTHPFPGFPTALYADRRWGSASNSQIYLPAVVKLRAGEHRDHRDILPFAEAQAQAAVLRDLRKQPDLILVDEQTTRHSIGASRFNFVQFYSENAEIAALLSHYRKLGNAPQGFAAYLLRNDTTAEETGL